MKCCESCGRPSSEPGADLRHVNGTTLCAWCTYDPFPWIPVPPGPIRTPPPNSTREVPRGEWAAELEYAREQEDDRHRKEYP